MGKVFRKYGADSDRIWTLITAILAILTTVAVWFYPLRPRALELTLVGLLTIGFVVQWKNRKTTSWFTWFPSSIPLCYLLPFPWSGVLATLLLIAFFAVSRLQIADALLPVRAYFIRKKAQKR